MIYGLNLLLWTTEVNETHFPLLDDIRRWGYAAVEIPVFNLDPALHRRVGANVTASPIRWPALESVYAEGLLLEPVGTPVARVICLPDADWTPEAFAGLVDGV
ncbi:MAG: hypothetical protein ACK5EA_04115, partial [Planctomycetaceae bacterium]